MRNRFSQSIFIACLTVCVGGSAAAQQEKKDQTTVTFRSGVTLIFTSETDPPSREKMTPGSVQVRGSQNVVHRIFLDRENKIYFGYDVEVEPLTGSDQYTLIIKPLSEPPIQQSNPPLTDLTSLALPKHPPPQTVNNGDTLALEVLVNPQTRVKITDFIRVSSTGVPSQDQSLGDVPSAADAVRSPIDLRPEMIFLQVTNSHLLINGQDMVGTVKGFGPGLVGSLLWFYLPNYGRFVLSLTPREGYDFRKAGVVQGRKVSFIIDGNRFDWISTSPIVPNVGDALNLWVLHEPLYRPDVELGQSPYLMGAVNNIKALLKKN